jgi:hypothetical protein
VSPDLCESCSPPDSPSQFDDDDDDAQVYKALGVTAEHLVEKAHIVLEHYASNPVPVLLRPAAFTKF